MASLITTEKNEFLREIRSAWDSRFFTYKTSNVDTILGTNINSRACTFVTGQETLDVIERLRIQELLSANVTQIKH